MELRKSNMFISDQRFSLQISDLGAIYQITRKQLSWGKLGKRKKEEQVLWAQQVDHLTWRNRVKPSQTRHKISQLSENLGICLLQAHYMPKSCSKFEIWIALIFSRILFDFQTSLFSQFAISSFSLSLSSFSFSVKVKPSCVWAH